MKVKKRVVVAMSGGVDSSVAAAILKKDGFEVIGMTMCFSAEGARLTDGQGSAYGGNIQHSERNRPSCCGIEGIEDAKRVAAILDTPHYVLNFGKILEEKVIKNFCSEYLSGRTPNPCVRCNQFLKFDSLFKKARELNADYLATGHYAKIIYSRQKKRFLLKKGKDKKKEQSYFLYAIKKEILPYILMPLGDFAKAEVRKIAHSCKLQIANKPGSQEICFVDTNYHEFLKTRITTNKMLPGPVIDTSGRVLGQHKGICFYTIGQREGLGIALGFRAYITKIDARKNIIVVGKEGDLYSKGLIAGDLNFLSINYPKRKLVVKTKIRYNHKEIKSLLVPIGERKVRVEFVLPQRAITPGQSAVFYQNDTVVGGGIIK